MTDTRPLTLAELAILADGLGIDAPITCYGDHGYGPCGRYTDWTDGRCVDGHEIRMEVSA